MENCEKPLASAFVMLLYDKSYALPSDCFPIDEYNLTLIISTKTVEDTEDTPVTGATSSYIFGGLGGSNLQDCDEYIPDTWTSKSDMPSPGRNSFASAGI